MTVTQQAFSIHQAFAWMMKTMKEENREEHDKIMNRSTFIDLDIMCPDNEEEREKIKNIFEGSNFVLGWCEAEPDVNPNMHKSYVKDEVIKGDKKWKTEYVAVYDSPYGAQMVKGSRQAIKKDCVDVARAVTAAENRDTFVILGRSPDGFHRCNAQVLYKPGGDQKIGIYTFVW